MHRLILVVVTFVAMSVPAAGQVADHLKCYTTKDPVALTGVVDLTSPQFGVEPGCKISRAHFFCVPATKEVVSARDNATGLPITPLAMTGPDAGDRVCYKIKCPVDPPPPPPDTLATDQFGTRTLTHFRAAYLCAPAVIGTPAPTATATPIPTPTATTPPPRFVDNGDGTVTDNQTGLQWEKKTGTPSGGSGIDCPLTQANEATCDADPHNVNNTYQWSASGTAPDGDAFTHFLSILNGGATGVGNCQSGDGTTITGGFAGHCDWRLPTSVELQSIVDLNQQGCGTAQYACIDVGVFGATAATWYWTSTTVSFDQGQAWVVDFYDGATDEYGTKSCCDGPNFVRAVRGGR
jgi:hypothetical protein